MLMSASRTWSPAEKFTELTRRTQLASSIQKGWAKFSRRSDTKQNLLTRLIDLLANTLRERDMPFGFCARRMV